MKKILIAFALILSFTSCEKDNEEQGQGGDPCTINIIRVDYDPGVVVGNNIPPDFGYIAPHYLLIISQFGTDGVIIVTPQEYEAMIIDHSDEYCFP